MRTYRYRITVSGGLGETGREASGDFDIRPEGADTVLSGDLDQAALHGALDRGLFARQGLHVSIKKIASTKAVIAE